MKKIVTLFTIVALSSFSLIAQNSSTKKADKHFARFEFIEAAEEYKELIEDGKGDTYVYSKLAESYYNVFNTQEAEKWYAKALETADNPEMIFKYSQMLKANGKYEESNVQMAKFAKMRPSDDRAIAYNENPDYLPKILEKGKKFNIQSLGFNTQYSDFGGTLKDGKLYITSARNTSRKTYGWNEEPFLDIYELVKNEDGTYQAATLVEDKVNTKHHEGIVSFSPDGKTMYFSRESFFEKEYEKDSLTKVRYSLLHLFKAKKVGDTWSNVEGFAINSKNYSIKNPSVSPDGKTLYFASDMPGGFGMFDIYKSTINGDGSLGEPVNLGQKVNTQGQEMFPFISSNNTLYFSSNGHLGLGNLDVFHTKVVDGKTGPVKNIGIPINSSADDFAFNIDEESKEGYVSSNRDGGLGGDDIYGIKRLQPLNDVLVASTVVDSKTGNPVNAASVTLYDDQGNKVLSKVTNSDGTVDFIIESDKDAELEVVLDGYVSQKIKVSATNEEEVKLNIMLDPIDEIIKPEEIVLNPIFFEFDKSNVTAQAAFELDKLVQIMNKYPDMVINAKSHTDNRGSAAYNEKLSDRRAKTTVQYVISKGIDKSRISGVGKGENEPKVDCGANCTEEEHQMNRRSEFIIVSGGPQAK
ncbi:OmpA family protein [Psychroserpens mesophilus]|uniref:OmpA family protein n=1 Tax=Psychroserpens mesophilus TaxID=325473 RepID=UPI0005901BF8|nr:OmpA family protein [Psychroserpens mesophilus]